jgi:hypothetical protein
MSESQEKYFILFIRVFMNSFISFLKIFSLNLMVNQILFNLVVVLYSTANFKNNFLFY